MHLERSLPGVVIRLVKQQTNEFQSGTSDEQGRFSFLLLSPGLYQVEARMAIEDTRKHAGGRFISDVTFFEVASLVARQRVGLHISLETFLEEVESRFAVLPITRHIAARAVQLPNAYPRDPVDRIIGATAIIEGLALVTADRAIQRAKAVRTVW